MWQQKAQGLESEVEDLKQEVHFKTSADNLRLQMKLKVKEQHADHLQTEIQALNKKLGQKFEILDSKNVTTSIESDVIIQKLETQLKQAKFSL